MLLAVQAAEAGKSSLGLSLTRSADWLAARVVGGALMPALAVATTLLPCLQDEVAAAGITSLTDVDEGNGLGPEVAPVEEDAADSQRRVQK